MSQITKKRILCFDLLKLLSIFYVFAYHIYMDMYVIHPMHNLKLFGDLTIRPNMHFAMIACGLFILISGATITYTNNNRDIKPIEFYKKRLMRVLIPFYIAYFIYFVIKVISLKNIHIYGGVPKWRIIYTMLGIDEYLNACGVKTFSLGVGEWFLGCIILCYLVYPFLYKAHKKNSIITFIVMTIYYIILNVNYDKFGFTIPNHMNFFSQVYNFYLGIAFGNKRNKRDGGYYCNKRDTGNKGDGGYCCNKRDNGNKRNRGYYNYCLLITLPTILFFYFYKPIINIPVNFKTTIVVICITISFYIFENVMSNNRILNKGTSLFNKISYEFFLVHHFIIYQVDFMLNYRRLNGIETLIVIAADLVLTILMAIVVNRISSNKRDGGYYCNKRDTGRKGTL